LASLAAFPFGMDRLYMITTDQILSGLSLLRRHARILCGDRAQADQLVSQAIKRMGRSSRLRQSRGESLRSPKTALFAAFHELLPHAPSDTISDVAPDESIDARLLAALRALPSSQRDVVLLGILAEFAPREIANILAMPVSYVHRTLGTARRTMHRHLGARVLVMEDDPVIAVDLQHLVNEQGHTVVGIADTPSSALDLAKRHVPDLVLADVRLHGRDTGVAAAAAIQHACDSAVIFLTGYPERIGTVLSAQHAIILKKPVEPTRLEACIRRVLSAHNGPLMSLVEDPRPARR
jgi:CheY-like chemotaxis protein/DNA-directed RNA polymerase specialized sigma24 family protein